jgi:hypothetical protein
MTYEALFDGLAICAADAKKPTKAKKLGGLSLI